MRWKSWFRPVLGFQLGPGWFGSGNRREEVFPRPVVHLGGVHPTKTNKSVLNQRPSEEACGGGRRGDIRILQAQPGLDLPPLTPESSDTCLGFRGLQTLCQGTFIRVCPGLTLSNSLLIQIYAITDLSPVRSGTTETVYLCASTCSGCFMKVNHRGRCFITFQGISRNIKVRRPDWRTLVHCNDNFYKFQGGCKVQRFMFLLFSPL